MANQLTRYATVATVGTVGEGHFFGGIALGARTTGAGVLVGVVDRVQVLQFVLPFRASFNRVVTRLLTAGGAGKLYGVALYDVDKNLIVESGALDANAVATNNTTITLTQLEPGIYWFAHTSDSATTKCTAFDLVQLPSLLTGIDSPRMGLAANAASTPGTFPATLGAINGAVVVNPVVSLFGLE
ncbi:hypothetical protein LCGC14_1802000 [marine sediment metagenome]|uniref:Uncharacterized protein n=1 Tax=marine sediment metagenome TaxID=412755 RepID=A0A0F8YV32_9ZZZZ